MKPTIYFVPFSEAGLENKLFAPFANKNANVPPFDYLKQYLEERGFGVKTIDFWDKKNHREEDVVVVFDHPPVGLYKMMLFARDFARRKQTFPLKNRHLLEILPHFKKKILMQWESPANNPWVYRNIPAIVRHYDKVFFIPKAARFPHFHYPQNFDALNATYFDAPRKSFMVMMNSSSRAKGFWNAELYSKRVEALRFFADHGDVELYGPRWDRSGLSFVRKIWKGFAENKPLTMSNYNFVLCFENATWPGYVTEKIFDCMVVGTIPIYWGAPDIEEDVPTECFIDMRKFKNYGELRSFLRGLTAEDIRGYREAMRRYFISEQFKKFTPKHFGETVLEIISS